MCRVFALRLMRYHVSFLLGIEECRVYDYFIRFFFFVPTCIIKLIILLLYNDLDVSLKIYRDYAKGYCIVSFVC